MTSLIHGAGAAERNWSAHSRINSSSRGSQTPKTLNLLTSHYVNQRLVDNIKQRGIVGRKKTKKVEYPKSILSILSSDEEEEEPSCDDDEESSIIL